MKRFFLSFLWISLPMYALAQQGEGYQLVVEDPLVSEQLVTGESTKSSEDGEFTPEGWVAQTNKGKLVIELSEGIGYEGALKVDVRIKDWKAAHTARPDQSKIHFINMFSNPNGDHHYEDGGTRQDALWTLRSGSSGGDLRYGLGFKVLYASQGAKRAPGSDYHEEVVSMPSSWDWSAQESYTFQVNWSKMHQSITLAVNDRHVYTGAWKNQTRPLKYIFLGRSADFDALQGVHFRNLRVYRGNPEMQLIRQYAIFEEALVQENATPSNLADTRLDVTYTAPDGRTVDFPGFYAGHGIRKFRFMPDMPGKWHYRAKVNGVEKRSGTFECIPSDLPGVLKPYQKNPIWFSLNGDEPILIRSFHIGDRYFAKEPNQITGEAWNEGLRQEFLDWLQAQGYNMLSIAGFLLNRREEGRGLGWNSPDLWDEAEERPRAEAFEQLEKILRELQERRIFVYPFAGFIGRASDVPKPNRKKFIDYALARLAPFYNLIWNVGGPEPLLPNHPFMNQEEVHEWGSYIKEKDVFGHMVAVHNPTGDDAFKDSNWSDYGILQGPKTTNRRKLSQELLKNHHPQKPLYAQETLWPGNTFGHPPYSAEDTRKNAIVMNMSAATINLGDMNGSSSSGFSGSIDLKDKVQPRHDILKEVWDFFEQLPYAYMKPAPERVDQGFCLANAGNYYLVYLEYPASVTVTLAEGKYRYRWMEAARTTAPSEVKEIVVKGSTSTFPAPSKDTDWFLWIEQADQPMIPLREEQAYARSLDPKLNFIREVRGYAPFYIDKGKRKDYVGIKPNNYHNQWAAAKTIFSGAYGRYNLYLTAYKEYDGESIFRIRVNDKIISEKQCSAIASKAEEGDQVLTWKRVVLSPGDVLMVEAKCHSNRKVPEEGSPGNFGWSRARWRELLVEAWPQPD